MAAAAVAVVSLPYLTFRGLDADSPSRPVRWWWPRSRWRRRRRRGRGGRGGRGRRGEGGGRREGGGGVVGCVSNFQFSKVGLTYSEFLSIRWVF